MIHSFAACQLFFDFLLLTFYFPGGADERPRGESRPLPRPEAVAETRLLMEALMEPNFRGLEKVLGTRPANTESWTFARGQALLIAETGNLLMLRQPRVEGKEVWLQARGSCEQRPRDWPGPRQPVTTI